MPPRDRAEFSDVIVVAGESLIDLTASVGLDGSAAYTPRPGGSPLNVAVGLARLGTEVAFLTRLSTDRFGNLLAEHLQDEGVSGRYVVRGPEPTALAFAHTDADGQATYEFRWDATADRLLRPDDLPALDPSIDALHVGSASLALDPGGSVLQRLVERNAGKRLISLDPNVRPELVADRRVHRHFLEDLMSSVDLVKVSTQDLAWLYPPAKPGDVARWWLALGATLVVITDGDRGATAYNTERDVAVPATKIDVVVDTIGAGDAFTAAMLTYLSQREALSAESLATLGRTSLDDMLERANRAAALTCSRAGADPPRRGEL